MINSNFIIIGVHRTLREVVIWAGKGGFIPLTRSKEGPPCAAKEISGDVAERIMAHLTKRSTTTKYEFFLVPVVPAAYALNEGMTEAGLIIPRLH